MNLIKFSETELIDLLWAWAAISFAFAVVLGGGIRGVGNGFPERLILAAVTVGVAFLLHELGHKFVAQKYGYWAEFRRFDFGLILAVILSFFGTVFAAPGAVMIDGLITNEQNGKIAVAGPLVNIVLAGLFLLLGLFLGSFNLFAPLLQNIVGYGIGINAWLALFNMLPIPPLDGSKVISWSLPAWIGIIAIASFILFRF
jgi:Zn-dependent protease